ncbi:Plasmid replication protein (fragment) [Pseudolactococcus piscium]
MIEDNHITEFEDLVKYARDNNYLLLSLIIDKTYFFARFLDSKRYKPRTKKNEEEKKTAKDN